MGRLLVQQDPHSFAGLHAAPHHSHQLWPYEVLELAVLGDPGLVAAQGRGPAGGRCRGLDIHGPVRVDVFCVIQLFVRLNGAANIAFTCWWGAAKEDEEILLKEILKL